MTKAYLHLSSVPRGQRGAVLITVLMFLVALTLLGLGAVSQTSVEEKMAQNARDQDVALQAAEAALRDARIRITGVSASPATPVNFYDFTTTCTNGLCGQATQPVFSNYSLDVAPSQPLGTGTTTRTLGVVAQQPRYLIERISIQVPGTPITASGISAYRITAKGFGRSANTQVIIQETFKPG
jgi:type IV pilus assembly protein PilX